MILKQIALYISVLLLATSCYQFKKPEKPKNLISKDKMVNILIDVKLLASANTAERKTLDNFGVDRTHYIFAKHNIDSLQFALSNNYYAYNVKEYEEIYTKIKDSLEELEAIYKKLELKEEKAKKEQDSLKALLKEKDTDTDSINSIKIQDSLRVKIKKDSLTEILLKKKFEEEGELILPVSDTDSQP